MRTILATALVLSLGLSVYPYAFVSWQVAVPNAIIIMYWGCPGSKYKYLPMLGMVGTLLGLMYAFTSIDTSALSDVAVVKSAIVTVLSGIGMAISTTLTAVILWLVDDWRCNDLRQTE